MEKEKQKKIGIEKVLLGCLVIFLIILFFILNSGHETHITGESEEKKITALDCSADNIKGAFFTSSAANTVKNQIKVTFGDDKVDKIFYFFEGVYNSYEVAEHDNAALHARYNKHMSGNGLEQESLTPTFSTVETKMRINLYAKNREMINRATAVLFFINSDDLEDYLDYSRDQVMEYYQKQGFLCEKQN